MVTSSALPLGTHHIARSKIKSAQKRVPRSMEMGHPFRSAIFPELSRATRQRRQEGLPWPTKTASTRLARFACAGNPMTVPFTRGLEQTSHSTQVTSRRQVAGQMAIRRPPGSRIRGGLGCPLDPHQGSSNVILLGRSAPNPVAIGASR